MKINIKNIKVKSICATLFISLFLSCNSGVIEDLEKRNHFLSSLANLGNDFLSVFTSFGDIIGSPLGFSTSTKKSAIADYFKKVKETVEGVKGKLNTIVENMKREGNPNASSTSDAVATLSAKLDSIIKGSNTASEAIGNDTGLIADFGKSGVGAAATEVDKLIEGIKGIVEVVLNGVGNAEAGDDNKATDLTARSNTAGDGEAGKLFATKAISSNEKKSATDFVKAVGAVTGADILQAMIKEGGDAAKLAKSSDGNATEKPKDATIAGAVALRAMAKNGKFANKSTDDDIVKKTVGNATISAVTKALGTLTIAIRKTIDAGLKAVKEAMKINPDDAPVITEAKN
ncbi:variable large family protein (plasmid) [Borrelia coriaceae]|uniref:Variable large protein n=1 Tax=Borrelia coriaceae ATCC 43381 TaxID=1408429 RepID=W5SXP2_9SPIR|nr:variable large family protein [Borrelia coriaceae]AHH11458.1 Variable outer membrane protein [Borrelia coriaceae ATCC 43381]UPA17288.1 variable large family protein [Borrelia coriaceae]